MRRPTVVTASVRAFVGMLAVVSLASACRSKEGGPDTTHTGASLPGTLSKPIDQYTGDELFAFAQRLSWGGGADRQRECTGDPACGGTTPTKFTTVRLDAVNEQDSLSAIHVPKNGVIAVRALNEGDLEEARYKIKPNKNFEYYLVVLPGDTKSGRWQLEELDVTAGARKHSTVASGTFTPCNHPFQRGLVNRANFYTCEDSHMSDSVQKSGLLLFTKFNDPIWLDCEHGCCIAG